MAERMASARRPAVLAGLLGLAALLLFLRGLALQLPPDRWWPALTAPAATDIRQMLVHYGFLPRFAMSLVCGAALGLSGALFQQVLRNPLAEPGTLGVFAGAKLALGAALLWAPWLLAFGPEPVALAGGGLALALVLSLAWKRGLPPFAVVLGGLVVTHYLGALNAAIALFHHAALSDLFVWQAGSLSQTGWRPTVQLVVCAALAALAVLALLRPLALADLEDDGARNVGAPVALTRLAAIAMAVVLAAMVASAAGIIAFIGLAGPAIARRAGARRLRDRLLWAPLLSAALLALADQAVQMLDPGREVSVGALTALFGAPLLLWLIATARPAGAPPRADGVSAFIARPAPWIVLLVVLLGLAVVAALSLGRTPDGWSWTGPAGWPAILPWRGPRVAAALAAGAMLATAGVILQRLTGNAMASPEILGVSAGAALGLVVVIWGFGAFGQAPLLAGASTGAAATLTAVLALSRRSAYAVEPMLLAGLALAAILNALVTVLLSSGDPRATLLLGWMAGSTYAITAWDALIAWLVAGAMAIVVPLTARWLAILPLGPAVGQALGVARSPSRPVLLLLAAVLTAAATLTVGPLSFIGLMAPHLVRLIGFQRPGPQLAAAALSGGLVMVAADWLGRNIAFPWQIPAGLMASMLGGAYFIWLMRRR
ncbi:Iron(3+)-hydroxamate import system permease protein FhuB [bacterium YEK0313]|nr:Iron(3+)-hydroxamate import system permease protein FhuB [bacterium YEK0313]